METEDLIKLPASSNSEHGSENGDACESGSEAINSESLPSNSEVIEEIHGEAPGAIAGVLDENTDALMEDDFEKGPNCNSATAPIGFEMTNSAADVGKAVPVSSVHAENGFLSIQSEISFSNLKKNETLSSKREIDANSLSGVKRPRMAVDEQQPSVHVIYSSLPRESKQKLEKLLEQWSQWHAHWSSSSDLFPHVNDKADVPLFNSGHKCVAGIWRRDLLPSALRISLNSWFNTVYRLPSVHPRAVCGEKMISLKMEDNNLMDHKHFLIASATI